MLPEGDTSGAVRLIAINPTLREQASEMLPALEGAKKPASGDEVMAIMIRHAPTYAIEDRSPNEWAQLFGVYVQALAGFSTHAIEDAFLRWNRGEDMKDPAMGQFFPKPAQLVHLAKKSKAEVWSAAYVARKAMEYVDKQPRQISDEERAQVAEGMRELATMMSPKAIPDEFPRPRFTPREVADRLRSMDVAPDDVGIVL